MIEDLSMHVADLVENALRAGAKHIRVALGRKGGALILEVTDDGQGMDPLETEKAMDPFYTTKDRPVKVGLGLPLLRQTAEELRGRLDTSSQPGRGTRVRLELPWDHPDRPPIGDLAGTLIPLIVTSQGVEFTLVLADDQRTWELDTREVRDHLGELPLTHPEVLSFLERYVREGMEYVGLKEDG